jgi:hypothetical protein
MTLLDRWDPFAELNILQRQMDRLFRDAFQGTFQFADSGMNGGSFVPSADVYETPDTI